MTRSPKEDFDVIKLSNRLHIISSIQWNQCSRERDLKSQHICKIDTAELCKGARLYGYGPCVRVHNGCALV